MSPDGDTQGAPSRIASGRTQVTVGFGLHKHCITACALDALGTALAEHRRLEPSLDALVRWLEALPQPVTVALEATLYWHWLERQLSERGMHVMVAHPYQVRLIWARTKTDPIDARKLAELARVHLLPSSGFPIPPRAPCGSCSGGARFSSGSGR